MDRHDLPVESDTSLNRDPTRLADITANKQLLKHVFWYIFMSFNLSHMIKDNFESAD